MCIFITPMNMSDIPQVHHPNLLMIIGRRKVSSLIFFPSLFSYYDIDNPVTQIIDKVNYSFLKIIFFVKSLMSASH